MQLDKFSDYALRILIALSVPKTGAYRHPQLPSVMDCLVTTSPKSQASLCAVDLWRLTAVAVGACA